MQMYNHLVNVSSLLEQPTLFCCVDNWFYLTHPRCRCFCGFQLISLLLLLSSSSCYVHVACLWSTRVKMWPLESLMYKTWKEPLFHETDSSLNIIFVLRVNNPPQKKNAKKCVMRSLCRFSTKISSPCWFSEPRTSRLIHYKSSL